MKISQVVTTAKELFELEVKEIPWLVHGILPKTGLAALAGSSDTGKSSFLRQLALEVTSGKEDFLGFKLHPIHRSVVYVSTEDDMEAMSFLINKQRKHGVNDANAENLRFIFESDNLLDNLERELERKPADCVIIDAFTDLFAGDLNSSNSVRTFLNKYREVGLKHNCLILFLHHTGKRTSNLAPSKDNLLGSQGFEGKMRTVLELRRDHDSNSKRHLCILKGNYILDSEKSKSYVLNFNEMYFENSNERVSFEKLSKPMNSRLSNRDEMLSKALNMREGGLPIREITSQLNEQGYKVGKTTVADLIKLCPSVPNA